VNTGSSYGFSINRFVPFAGFVDVLAPLALKETIFTAGLALLYADRYV
jgi:hypothetical protein